MSSGAGGSDHARVKRSASPSRRASRAMVRHGATLRHPGRVAAIEHAHVLEAVRPQAPPYAGREEALGVVVDHDRACRRRCRSGRPEPAMRSGPVSRTGHRPHLRHRPGRCANRRGRRRGYAPTRGARPAPVRSPTSVQDAHARLARAARPATRSSRGCSGRAKPDIVAMIRPWSRPSRLEPDRLAAVRAALPALTAGIYLNTGSVGPMPAETAAAMAEITAYERDRSGPRRLCRRDR